MWAACVYFLEVLCDFKYNFNMWLSMTFYNLLKKFNFLLSEKANIL